MLVTDSERDRTSLTRRGLLYVACASSAALVATPAFGAQRQRLSYYSDLRSDPGLEGDILSQGPSAVQRIAKNPEADQRGYLASLSRIPSNLFTPQEIRRHRERVSLIAETASSCLEKTYEDHVDFYRRHGVSKYYGARRYPTKQSRIAALRRYGKDIGLAELQVQTACILLAKDCLREGFVAADELGTWRKIDRILSANENLGTDLQIMLQQLGWRIYYWNPDPNRNESWDEEDRRLNPLKPGTVWNPVWGGHAARYASVMRSGLYSGKRVDDFKELVGFRTSPPDRFLDASFFVGIAHDGYHVFPGRRGEVIEAHSMREIVAFDNLELSPFNPLLPQGGPRSTQRERYRSGLIAVPEVF